MSKKLIISLIIVAVLLAGAAGAYMLFAYKAAAPSATPTPSVSVSASPTTEPEPATNCKTATKGWTTGRKDGGTYLSNYHIATMRTEELDCYDRITFELGGPGKVGFNAEYVPVVTADASGKPVEVAGKAFIRLAIDAATDMAPSAGTGLLGLPVLYEIKQAGSFEGITSYAIGVAHKAPFKVYQSPTDNGKQRVIVDIAH